MAQELADANAFAVPLFDQGDKFRRCPHFIDIARGRGEIISSSLSFDHSVHNLIRHDFRAMEIELHTPVLVCLLLLRGRNERTGVGVSDGAHAV